MCRFFAHLSLKSVDAPFLIQESPQSLLRQSTIDKKRRQGDGWGIGWFEQGRPKILKSPQPIYRDLPKIRAAGLRVRGPILFGHVRWASNPLKLPRRELIGLAHTQPFTHGRWLFAHNGTLLIPREVKEQLGPWKKFVKGKNDSEVLFYWLMKTWVPHLQKNPVSALHRSLKALDRIWETCRRRYPLYRYPYHGLNWVLSDGRQLIAFCFVNPRGFDQGKALGQKSQPYYQLQVQIRPTDVTVASEPLTREKNWQPLRHGELLRARKVAGRIAVERVQVF